MEKLVLVTGKTHNSFPPFGFQTFFFEELQQAADQLGISLFFVDPLFQNLGKRYLKGYIFKNSKWEEATSLLPKLIYYRFSSIAEDELAISEEFKTHCLENKAVFANPLSMVNLLNNKLLFYQFLEERNLADIPTVPLQIVDSALLKNWFETYKAIYLKPAIGSNGRGIKTVKVYNNQFLCNSEEGIATYDMNGLLNFFADHFKASYILQPAIFPQSIKSAPFDIRVMVQHTGIEYKITGMGIRQGKLGGNISNLKGGGSGIAIEDLGSLLPKNIETNILLKQIEQKCLAIVEVLDNVYGSFCEIAFDVLIDRNIAPVILEANANPGRWLFNKIADKYANGQDIQSKMRWAKYSEIRKTCVSTPLKYFKHKLVS